MRSDGAAAKRYCRFPNGLCTSPPRAQQTVRVVDGEPGSELQVDFGRMGLLFDLGSQRRRLYWG
ncbi:MAG TPA: hypothetical protein VKF14_06385 [Candidatus Dormibacteraeota bacterium]|nr:hypothetical protein [Candidatus Dormibacteraeota bacterium]